MQSILQQARDKVRLIWMTAVIYPGLGAGIAQGVLSAVVILAPVWDFPPPQNYQALAYQLGYVVGVFYGLYIECRRQGRKNTQGQDGKCCRCKPARACARSCRCKRACS